MNSKNPLYVIATRYEAAELRRYVASRNAAQSGEKSDHLPAPGESRERGGAA